jgi:hypothetical protein
MSKKWFVSRGDKTRGPLTSDEVKQMALTGILHVSDMVRPAESSDWRQAGTITGLFSAELSEARTPPPLPQLNPEAPVHPLSTASPTVSKLHPSTAKAAETMQTGLADIMSTAKQAKELASAHVRKTQITQLILPKAYLTLGKDVFSSDRFQDELSVLFQRITATNDEISKIATTARERPQATDIKGKLQTGAAQLQAKGQTTKLSYQRDESIRELGKRAFEIHGASAGSSDLVSPITSAIEEIAKLHEQIAAMSSHEKGPLWQRLPLAAFLTIFCWPIGILLVWLNPRLNRRSKWIWTGVSIGALVLLASVVPRQTKTLTATSTSEVVSRNAQNTTPTVEANPDDMILISPNQLFSEYDRNDIAADKKYKGKELQLTGTVGDISRDLLGNIYVTLKTGEYEIFSVQCFFADSFEDEVADLIPNRLLTIRGRCDGKFGNVMLNDCILVR